MPSGAHSAAAHPRRKWPREPSAHGWQMTMSPLTMQARQTFVFFSIPSMHSRVPFPSDVHRPLRSADDAQASPSRLPFMSQLVVPPSTTHPAGPRQGSPTHLPTLHSSAAEGLKQKKPTCEHAPPS